jgi:hypothetical protein
LFGGVPVPPPDDEIVIAPAVLAIVTPVPWVNVANVKPVPLPIGICPFVGVAVSPVPPRATPKVPVVPAVIGRPVQLVNVPEDGVPIYRCCYKCW